jgi:hypothetical protein
MISKNKLSELVEESNNDWHVFAERENYVNYVLEDKGSNYFLMISYDDSRILFMDVDSGDYVKMPLDDELEVLVENYLETPVKAYQVAIDKPYSAFVKAEED